jgi:hypothetical protein
VNKREQQFYQEYLTRLRSKDTELVHTPDGQVGPLERGFTSATSPEDFKGWVVGFYNEQSDELAKLPEMLADAQVARWQSKYGRDGSSGPTAIVASEQDTNGLAEDDNSEECAILCESGARPGVSWFAS